MAFSVRKNFAANSRRGADRSGATHRPKTTGVGDARCAVVIPVVSDEPFWLEDKGRSGDPGAFSGQKGAIPWKEEGGNRPEHRTSHATLASM